MSQRWTTMLDITTRDLGPDIRLRPIHARDRARTLLREADVTLEDGPDPDQPNRTVRRARRTDPLVVLRIRGSITGRGYDAAERLREAIQRAQGGSQSGAGQSEVHVPAHQRQPITAAQVEALTEARTAYAAIRTINRRAVLWAVAGGTVDGYARYARYARHTVATLVCGGLEELADHYEREGR